MKDSKKLGINTICAHIGEVKDEQFKGAVSPIYMSTSYAFDGVDVKRYPRYFNTPNQEMLCKKIAALEKTENAIIFGSGMAAVSTTLLAFLQKLDWGVAVLKSLDDCKRIAYENVEDAYNAGINYAELRFSPYYIAKSKSSENYDSPND